MGFEVETEAFFDTIVVRVPGQAARIAAKARESRINLRFIDANRLGISFDETVKRANLGRSGGSSPPRPTAARHRRLGPPR